MPFSKETADKSLAIILDAFASVAQAIVADSTIDDTQEKCAVCDIAAMMHDMKRDIDTFGPDLEQMVERNACRADAADLTKLTTDDLVALGASLAATASESDGA